MEVLFRRGSSTRIGAENRDSGGEIGPQAPKSALKRRFTGADCGQMASLAIMRAVGCHGKATFDGQHFGQKAGSNG